MTPGKTKYVIVTAISTFRQRYCIPMDQLQELNTDMPVDPEWALDCVTCDEAEEFSQQHLGEQIVDHIVVSEKEMLELFDKDNSYLADWTKKQKLEHIGRWKREDL
jgi:hypothetical protein